MRKIVVVGDKERAEGKRGEDKNPIALAMAEAGLKDAKASVLNGLSTVVTEGDHSFEVTFPLSRRVADWLQRWTDGGHNGEEPLVFILGGRINTWDGKPGWNCASNCSCEGCEEARAYPDLY